MFLFLNSQKSIFDRTTKLANRLNDIVLDKRRKDYDIRFNQNIVKSGLCKRMQALAKEGICKIYIDLSDKTLDRKDIDFWEKFCLYEGFRGNWVRPIPEKYDGITLEW